MLLALLLLTVVVALPVCVYADTLDPTWEGGYWEDDDFDTVILLVTNLKASLPVEAPRCDPTSEAIAVVEPEPVSAPVIDRPLPFQRRGPPSA